MRLSIVIILNCLIFCISCQNDPSQGQNKALSENKPQLIGKKKNPNTKNKSDLDSKVKIDDEASDLLSDQINFKDNKVVLTPAVKKYCDLINKKFKKYGWGESGCEKVAWLHVRDSFLGRPLIWGVFGDESKIKTAKKEELNITLILCGVHGDEITPVKFCFDLIRHLKTLDHPWDKDLVAIAPIVTPDAFFRRRPTRTNWRGVDVNRNFPTNDWDKDALRLWKSRYRKDPRRFPGDKSLSEHETIFQVNLIKRYNPAKIISVHAPLTILDYDGPELGKGGIYLASNANSLLRKMSKKAKGYKIKNYPFFPGSLGNYAGNERHIPTYTLELPSSDYTKHKRFWNRFKESLDVAIFKNLNTKTAETIHAEEQDSNKTKAD